MCDSRGRVSVEAVQPGILVGFRGVDGGIGGKEVVQSALCESCCRICFGMSQCLDKVDSAEQEKTHLPRRPRTHCSRRVLPSVVYGSISVV